MRITGAEPTLLFTGTAAQPLQVVRVTLADLPDTGAGEPGRRPDPLTVRIEGPGVATPVPFRMDMPGGAADGEQDAEVAVRIAAPHGPGSTLPATVVAERGSERAELDVVITVAEPGWSIWMVSHFHYDPVWWNTQGQFTQSRLLLPDDKGELPDVRTAFELVRLHLDAARDDPDYKFVLAEIDYLKPYFDVHPADRAELGELIAAGRVEIVGGMYNEPNTNLTCAESTVRNIVYGLGHQRDVMGADPGIAWMLDAFGFDPSYPGLMAAAGLSASAWARGPYHQWGPRRTVGGNERMQFPSEFEWVSPDGRGLLTSYMPNHYGAGWGPMHRAADPAAAQTEALAQLAALAPAAATRNVLLPVGEDHTIPARWATAVHRRFAERYVWPRCVTAVPREFFAAVRAEAAERGIWFTPQSRDMNPVYPGKDVSYIDTKQAQRAAEVAVCDGERLATLAWLAGAGYPAESLDKAWRQLVFGAHHDSITGTESDQVYLDLLGGWREAFERGDEARHAATSRLVSLADTRPPADGEAAAPQAQAVVVFNTLSWPRRGLASVTLDFPKPAATLAGQPPGWVALWDSAGAQVPFLAEGVQRHPDGALAGATLTFRADVPALGYRTYWAAPAPGTGEAGWRPSPGTMAENEAFIVHADPARGGALTSVRDRRSGTELLRGPGNELLVQEEYDYHPRWGEGPWLLSPKGPGTGSAQGPASVVAQRCALGSRLVVEFRLSGLRVTQETVLWDGLDRVEFNTHLDGSIGQDRLLRVRFPVDVPGGLPVYQCAATVVGRPFGSTDADVAEHPFTLDNPAYEWFGLGSTARVRAGGRTWATGVAEIILPGKGAVADEPAFRDAVAGLVGALAAQGVTATCATADGPRYGSLDLDSNLPDFRIALGGLDHNTWTARLAAAMGPDAAAELAERCAMGETGRVWVPASRPREEVFVPGADVRGERDLPVLVVAGGDLAVAVTSLASSLAGAEVVADLVEDGEPWDDATLAGHTVALLNRGTPSSLVTPDGTLSIALMRSCSAWPCGVWIDGDRRTTPDGTSFAWQHWSHTFSYALASGTGDWRDAGFTPAAEEYNHDFLTCVATPHEGPLPGQASLCEVAVGAPPDDGAATSMPRPEAVLSALKPRGNGLASLAEGQPRRDAGVTVRLRDGGGRAGQPATAYVRLFTGIEAAHLSSLPEDTDGPALVVNEGRAEVEAPIAGMVTMAVTPSAATFGGAAETQAAERAGGGAEPAQPVFTRYWLHGKGPAPAGNLPVAVHLSPGRLALAEPDADEDSTSPEAPLPGSSVLRLTVACGPRPARGRVELVIPAGIEVRGPDGDPPGPFSYDLPGRGHQAWNLWVRAAPGAGRGRYFVGAQVRDELGQVLEDAAMVSVGEPPAPALDLPLDELLPLLAADDEALHAEVDMSLRPASLRLAPDSTAELTVHITNRSAAPVRGESQLVSPWGTWDGIGPWTQGFAAEPGETVVLHYPVTVTARPGWDAWAVAKVMYFGRVRYSEAVSVAVEESSG
ncbi:MAG TPA: glycoside hydrolase family 38 C-terminal domain-containing protein [Streptosporangiaceae bacterium]|nr:glycoside hydrolase family 38 C-terminal domain-containing protein [Streptosporangiaceae bacterium]